MLFKRLPWAIFQVLLAVLLTPAISQAQAIPRDEYLTYVPLHYPSLVSQTPASERFGLFGDPGGARYRDLDPVDGIDDDREELLKGLGARFGPIMVLNTTNLPMDFRRFMDKSRSFNLQVDTWSQTGNPKELLGSRTVDLTRLQDSPCGHDHDGTDPAGDCLLLQLLGKFDPRDPDYQDLSPRAVAPEGDTFMMMFFDFPGEGPDSWKKEFQNNFSNLLPRDYRDFLKVYMHPFIDEVQSPLTGHVGYEFVLQYYFFYPTNDGGNNHEGDWEHINVHIAPRSTVTRHLDEDQVRGILKEGAEYGMDRDDPLVIRSVDYYFHHQVYRMDMAEPNAYAPVAEWKEEFNRLVPENNGEQKLWKWQRYSAWWDHEETIPNTHPICFVGADNKGLDQIMSSPGGKNRDSHGTYPYPGLFKDVGPGGATEQINSQFDPRKYYLEHVDDLGRADQTRFGRGEAVPYFAPERIEVWADWERIVEPVMTDVTARRDWFWMLLPVRWGYPATESPFAGIIPHAETGNLSPLGPMFQPHWNRTGSNGGSNMYRPHMFLTLFPLGLQDSFVNSWGFMNLTLPVLATLPPIDFAWRLVAYPFRLALQRNDPVFFPTEKIPTRFVGLNVGVTKLFFNEEVGTVLLNGDSGIELLTKLVEMAPEGFSSWDLRKEDPLAWWWQVNMYMGDTFSTQNTLLHSRSDLGMDVFYTNGGGARVDSEFNLWEFAGSFRFNMSKGGFQPYLKGGYGWTWYRVENITLDGELLDNPNGPWIHRPSLNSWSEALPNSWHVGGGLEIFLIRTLGPFPQGVDVSFVLETTFTRNNLGVEEWLLLAESDDLRNDHITSLHLQRWSFNAGLTLGF